MFMDLSKEIQMSWVSGDWSNVHLTVQRSARAVWQRHSRVITSDSTYLYLHNVKVWEILNFRYSTCRYEIYAELPEVNVVMASVGGGGLIGGMAAYLKYKNPNIRVSKLYTL